MLLLNVAAQCYNAYGRENYERGNIQSGGGDEGPLKATFSRGRWGDRRLLLSSVVLFRGVFLYTVCHYPTSLATDLALRVVLVLLVLLLLVVSSPRGPPSRPAYRFFRIPLVYLASYSREI